MQNGNYYEKNRHRDKFLALSSLALFTIASALISLVVMDILVFPLALFAVIHKNIYNFIIKDTVAILILFMLISLPVKKIISFRKEGKTFREIAAYLVKRPLYHLSTLLFVIFLSSVIILFLYLVLNSNYRMLYKITNG